VPRTAVGAGGGSHLLPLYCVRFNRFEAFGGAQCARVWQIPAQSARRRHKHDFLLPPSSFARRRASPVLRCGASLLPIGPCVRTLLRPPSRRRGPPFLVRVHDDHLHMAVSSQRLHKRRCQSRGSAAHQTRHFGPYDDCHVTRGSLQASAGCGNYVVVIAAVRCGACWIRLCVSPRLVPAAAAAFGKAGAIPRTI
jgi:hypothetical protein